MHGPCTAPEGLRQEGAREEGEGAGRRGKSKGDKQAGPELNTRRGIKYVKNCTGEVDTGIRWREIKGERDWKERGKKSA